MNKHNSKGYTLIEMVIAMAIFAIVASLLTFAFQTLLKRSSQLTKSAESSISGIVGLEIMRADIARAGYGLPWSGLAASPYTEVPSSTTYGIDPSTFNESVPLALTNGVRPSTGVLAPGGAYLVIKSTNIGTSPTMRKWSFLTYSTIIGTVNNSYINRIKPSGVLKDPDQEWASGDHAIVLNCTFSTSGDPSRQLMMNGTAFDYTFGAPVSGNPNPNVYTTGSAVNDSLKPTSNISNFLVYGLGTTTPNMPWNRADYFVDLASPTKPASCNPGTGVLSKVVNGGSPLPLLDCVGDLQIVYYLDMDDDGSPGTYAAINAGAPPSYYTSESFQYGDSVQATLADPAKLRNRLKQVMVYVLAQEGKKDSSFSYPVNDTTKTIVVGPQNMVSVSHVWSQSQLAASTAFGAAWRNYRWRVYSFTVNLENLL